MAKTRADICDRCGGAKSFGANLCTACRALVDEEQAEAYYRAAYASPEARAVMENSGALSRHADRYVRIFRRWRRWRRKFLHALTAPPVKDDHTCLCGGYKTAIAKSCDECKDVKKILKQRVAAAGRNSEDQSSRQCKYVPRIIDDRVVRRTPRRIWESAVLNSWDNVVKTIEDQHDD